MARVRLADLPAAYVPPFVRDRAGLMAEIEHCWADLDGLVGGLDNSQLGRRVPGLGEGAQEWTVQDVLVHLAAWKRNAAEVARRQAGRRTPLANNFPGRILGFRTDDFNADLLRRWRDQPSSAVLTEHRAAHRDLLAALEAVPIEFLVRRGRSVLWLTPAIGHPRLHLEDLRRALA